MGWNVDTGIQAQNVLAQIETRLQANGWSQYDATSKVYTATNNQGVPMYLQVSVSGTYLYIQFQGWRLWNAGTHTGTNGSSTSYARLYLGGSAIGATVTVDLYSSVTANRAIFLINSQSTNYRSWAYAGGLDSVAGTNDPGCYVLISSYENANTFPYGQILDSPGGSSAFWGSCYWLIPAVIATGNAALAVINSWMAQQIPADSGKILLYPVLCASSFLYTSGFNSGLGPMALRGNLDGLLFCPLGSSAVGVATGSGALGHLDTVTIGATTYLVWQPGGTPTANVHPWTGSYIQAIAISET